MPPDQRWRYIVGTFLLLVSVGLAVAACFGVAAETTTFKAKAFGVECQGASIVALSIVVFAAAGLLLLRARKETPMTKTQVRHRMFTTDSQGHMNLMRRRDSETIYVEVPNPVGRLLRETVIVTLVMVAALVVFAIVRTTSIGL